MKMKRYLLSFLSAVALGLISCSSDDSTIDTHNPNQPIAVFKVDYQPIVRPNDILSVTPTLYSHDSSNNCKINKVDYYWDGELIETLSKSPFTFQHKVSGASESAHRLVLIINVGGKGYSNTDFTQGYDIKVGNYGQFDMVSPNKLNFENGETITLNSYWIDDNVSSWDKHIMRIYWDRKLIGETESSHLKCDYQLFGESVGEHTIYFEHTTETYQDGKYIGGGSGGTLKYIVIEK